MYIYKLKRNAWYNNTEREVNDTVCRIYMYIMLSSISLIKLIIRNGSYIMHPVTTGNINHSGELLQEIINEI